MKLRRQAQKVAFAVGSRVGFTVDNRGREHNQRPQNFRHSMDQVAIYATNVGLNAAPLKRPAHLARNSMIDLRTNNYLPSLANRRFDHTLRAQLLNEISSWRNSIPEEEETLNLPDRRPSQSTKKNRRPPLEANLCQPNSISEQTSSSSIVELKSSLGRVASDTRKFQDKRGALENVSQSQLRLERNLNSVRPGFETRISHYNGPSHSQQKRGKHSSDLGESRHDYIHKMLPIRNEGRKPLQAGAPDAGVRSTPSRTPTDLFDSSHLPALGENTCCGGYHQQDQKNKASSRYANTSMPEQNMLERYKDQTSVKNTAAASQSLKGMKSSAKTSGDGFGIDAIRSSLIRQNSDVQRSKKVRFDTTCTDITKKGPLTDSKNPPSAPPISIKRTLSRFCNIKFNESTSLQC